MKTKGIWLAVFVCLWAMNLGALDESANQTKKAGYALLDAYVTSFYEMSLEGSGAGLEDRLRVMAGDAKKAKEAGEINLVFYSRYARLLAMTKLLVQPDQGNVLMPVIDREVADFLLDITGEDPTAYKAGGARAIGQVANALAEEIINLQIYLDTLDKREGMRKKFDECMTEPRKK